MAKFAIGASNTPLVAETRITYQQCFTYLLFMAFYFTLNFMKYVKKDVILRRNAAQGCLMLNVTLNIYIYSEMTKAKVIPPPSMVILGNLCKL